MADYYIISSSGGGGHKMAAAVISQKKLDKHRNSSAKELDVMRSSCCYGSWLGRKCTNAWDTAQAEGNVKKQHQLFKFQAVSEAFFFLGTFFTVFNELMKGEQLPKKVDITQPFHLFAIITAIRLANMVRFRSKRKIKKVGVHFTDLPTDKCQHFLRSLKRLHWMSKTCFKMIRVYAPEPISTTSMEASEFWKVHSSLKPDQIKVENLPVGKVYMDAQALPLPGTNAEIAIKCLTPTEQAHMEKLHPAQKGFFEIKGQDKVGMVMLGSVPEKQAILSYVDEMIAASKEVQPNPGSDVYLFVACGSQAFNGSVADPKSNICPPLKPDCLYSQVCRKIVEAKLPSNIKIVPFIGQPVSRIFGRSDLSVTRSGGSTSGEILALKKREGDNKRILIHSPLKKFSQDAKEEKGQILLDSIPLWENGNAEYLAYHKDVNAQIINSQCAKEEFKTLFEVKAELPVNMP